MQGEPYLQWTPRVVEPDGDQREEWWIYGALAHAMARRPVLDPDTADPLPALFDGALAGAGLSIGALRDAGGVAVLPEPGPGGSVDRLGITEIHCAPEALHSTLARGHHLFAELRAEHPNQLKLITRRTLGMINSTLGNVTRDHVNPEREVNPLWINPDDAERLGLPDGARASMSNDHGTIEADVRYDPRLRPGTVAMSHGYGNQTTPGMSRAQERPGVNVNVLAPIGPGTFDPVSCMSHVTGIPVEVHAV